MPAKIGIGTLKANQEAVKRKLTSFWSYFFARAISLYQCELYDRKKFLGSPQRLPRPQNFAVIFQKRKAPAVQGAK
jgi:hypothetical protein